MRTKVIHLIAMAMVWLSLGSAMALGDSYLFSLVPTSGSIEGPASSVIGWGYSISNDSSIYWLDALDVNAGIFQHGTLDSGDYFDYPLVAPDTTVTVPFAQADSSGFGKGLAALTWDAGAPLDFTNSGDFVISVCWATNAGTCVMAAPDGVAAYSATVVAAAPEPTAARTVALGVLLFSILAWKTKLQSFSPLRPVSSESKQM